MKQSNIEYLKEFYSLNDEDAYKFLNSQNVEKLTIFRDFYKDYKNVPIENFGSSEVVETSESIPPPPTYLLDKNNKLYHQLEDMILVSDIELEPFKGEYLLQLIHKWWGLNASDKIHCGLAMFLCDVIIVEVDIVEKRECVKIVYSLDDEEVDYFLNQKEIYAFYEYYKKAEKIQKRGGNPANAPIRMSILGHALFDYTYNRRTARRKGKSYNLAIFKQEQEEKKRKEDEQYDKVRAEWMKEKREPYKQKELKEELENQFSTLSKWQNNILEVAKGNYANGEILTQISIEQGEVDSWFTDFQAFCICKGYKEKKMLYDKFSEGTYTPQDQLNAHRFAMKMLNNGQGREMIGFLMSLPEETFKCEPFAKLFEMIQKEDFKGIEYKFLGKSETLKVGYHQKELFGKEYIEVRNAENRIAFIVNREGGVKLESNIEDKMKNKNITNILNVVYQFLERNDL